MALYGSGREKQIMSSANNLLGGWEGESRGEMGVWGVSLLINKKIASLSFFKPKPERQKKGRGLRLLLCFLEAAL